MEIEYLEFKLAFLRGNLGTSIDQCGQVWNFTVISE